MIESDKLRRILHANAAFDVQELAAMSDADGWAWVYLNKTAPRDRSNQICFTGFTAAECERLYARASASGWLKPVGTVTAKLAFLCTGTSPGPAKIEKARTVGAEVIDLGGFDRLIETGELPARRTQDGS